jgi:hypothetical protein
MKTDIGKASEEDIAFVTRNMTERHREEWAAVLPDKVELLPLMRELYAGGVCARLGGEPVAVGDVFSARPNVIALGLITTDAFPAAALAFTKFLRNSLFARLKAEGVHRIECATLTHFTAAHKWMRMLGLSEETVLRKHGRNGEDFTQFSWVAG